MNKKNVISAVLLLSVVAVLAAMSAKPKTAVLTGSQEAEASILLKSKVDASNASIEVSSAEKVEVFLFHRTQRCVTCIAIGKLSGQTVAERFSEELKSGKVIFREVNIDELQNKMLAEKFKASGSSLFINAINNGSDNIQEDIDVWSLTGDEAAFKDHLANKISGLLGKQ
ncbi:MAG: nitrophenyl compound nitroreductase subunit ArsF family protein [Candidatus Paceibacterota bacterium]|jgi:hypothetical protein